MGLLALQVLWTRDSEVALNTAKRDRTIMKRTNQWFMDILNSLIEVTIKDLTKYSRAKYEALITIHVHQRLNIHADISDNNNGRSYQFLFILLQRHIRRAVSDEDSKRAGLRMAEANQILLQQRDRRYPHEDHGHRFHLPK